MIPFKQAPLSAAILATLAFPAQADLVQYAFTSVQGEERSLTPSTTSDPTYANPGPTLRFALSAGLDRKVRITLLKANGATIISSAVSGILGSSDRITINGETYYGAWLELATPTPEGEYVVRSEILSSSNTVVSTDVHRLVIDVTPPTAGEFSFEFWYGHYAPDGKVVLAPNDKAIVLNNIDDALSGVSKIVYENFWKTGSQAGEMATSGVANYFVNDQKAVVGDGTSDGLLDANFTSPGHSENTVFFNVYDKAGNKTSKHFDYYNNATCGPAPTLVALRDPDFSGMYMGRPELANYKEVSSLSNEIKELPAKFLYRIPRNQYEGINSVFGIYFFSMPGTRTFSAYYNKVLYDDGEFVYVETPVAVQADGSASEGWRNDAYSLICGYLSIPNPVIADSAKPPVLKNLGAYIEGYGWIGRSFYVFANTTPPVPLNTKISQIKVTVEPRPYRQRWTKLGSCYIEIGQSECIASVDFAFNQDGALNQYSFTSGSVHLASDANVLSNILSYNWRSDRQTPQFVSLIEHNAGQRKLVFDVYDPQKNGNFTFDTGGIDAKNGLGQTTRLGATSIASSADGDTHRITAFYTSLPDGIYNIFGWAIDSFRNEGKDFELVSGIMLDSTPPVINFSITNDAVIETLDEIQVTLSDAVDAAPTITSIVLQGGPTNDRVNLAARAISQNQYALEYPVMFPSDGLEGAYTLTVTAKDAQNNTITKSVAFSFEPVVFTPLDGFGDKLFLSSNVRTHDLRSHQISINNEILQGTYEITATLRADSVAPLVLNNVTVAPGETKAIGHVNLALNDGRIVFPLALQEGAENGWYYLLITVAAPNTPMFQASISTWSLQASDNAFEDTVRLTWNSPDPAMRYEVYREGVRLANVGDQLVYEDAPPARGLPHLYEIHGFYSGVEVTNSRPADAGSIPFCRAARLVGATPSAEASEVVGLLERLTCLPGVALSAKLITTTGQSIPVSWGPTYGHFAVPVPEGTPAGAYTLELTIDSGSEVVLNNPRTYDVPINLNYDHLKVTGLTITHNGSPASDGMETDSIGRFGLEIEADSGVGLAIKEN